MISNRKVITSKREIITCPDCNGTGVAVIKYGLHSMYDDYECSCSKCEETGKIIRETERVIQTETREYPTRYNLTEHEIRQIQDKK